MEISNKKKIWTLLGFATAVAIPTAMIIHTVGEGAKAAVITADHVDEAKASVTRTNNVITATATEFDQLDLSVMYSEMILDTNDSAGSFESYIVGESTLELDKTAWDALAFSGALEEMKYNTNTDWATTAPVEVAEGSAMYYEVTGVAIDYTLVNADEAYATITFEDVAAIHSGLDVTANFAFAAKEGFALVRTNPDADNSQASFINFSEVLKG